jgi:ABC-2 type transport system permease protein
MLIIQSYRVLRIFGRMVSMTVQRELAYRVNLLFQAALALTRAGAGLAALTVVYAHVTSLAGWTDAQATVLLGNFEIVSGFLGAFVEPNLAWFAGKIYRGELDDLLLQPAPSLFTISLSTCQPWALTQVAPGTLIVALGVTHLGTAPTAAAALSSLILLLIGGVIMWASRLLLATLAFWAPGLELSVLYSGCWQLGRYPIGIYPNAIRWALTYIVPVAFSATFPAYALAHKLDPLLLVGGTGAAGGACLLVSLIWRAGLRRYTSATS